MSAALVPMITSKWLDAFVRSLTSWQRTLAFVKRTLERLSALGTVVELRSNHWKALLIFAKQNRPSGLRSCNLLLTASWGITRETNDELLLMILFFGFLLFRPSLPPIDDSKVLEDPNAGALPFKPGPKD